MAKKSHIVSCNRKKEMFSKAISLGKAPYKRTRVYNRCELCGRVHGYMGVFKMCRICFRENAADGLIPGVTKSSW